MRSRKQGLSKRRKREGRTDYRKRLAYVKSGKVRAVIRFSNKNVSVQFVEYKPDGDRVLLTVTSKMLEKSFGWKGSRKNVPAAYVTGVLAAKTALKKGVKEAIADIGLLKPHVGARVYGVIKGLIDGGVRVPCSEKAFPSKERLEGVHLKNKIDVNSMKGKVLA